MKTGGTSARTQAVNLVAKLGVELSHSPDGLPFARVPVGEHKRTLYVNSPAFPEWLAREFYRATKRVPASADLRDAVRVIASSARHAGPERPVSVRLARQGTAIYFDLGLPDYGAIEVDTNGWRYVANPPVLFWRPKGFLPLPMPVSCHESPRDILTRLVNTGDSLLLLGWLVGALSGRKPFPVLTINGEQGSAKTTTCAYLRRTIDPNIALQRLPPREPRDLMLYARNSLVVAFDNLSVIPDWLSDALCVLSTGGGFSTRELYSDLEETLFSAVRPVMLNGITNVVTRPDLLDRALVVTLEPIPDDRRCSEAALEAEFQAAHPGLLAGLLDAVSMALANESSITLDSLPRMADFAVWIAAAAPALGSTATEMLDAYKANRDEAVETVLDGDVVVDALRALALPWTGQLKDLLLMIPEAEYKPKSPRGLRGALVRRAPALRHVGLSLTFSKGHVHTVTVARVDGASVQTLVEMADAVPF